MILYQALYNPMIHESASYTLSIHKTRKGAEMAIEFHKNEIKNEELELYDPSDVIGEYKWTSDFKFVEQLNGKKI